MTYHVFTLSVGKESLERIHIPHAGDSDTQENAEKQLKRSQRRRIISYRVARPTSHYREEIRCRENGTCAIPRRKTRRK